MDQAQHGVDFHEDGADLPLWGLVTLLAVMAFPVGLVAFLGVVVLR